MELQKHYTAIRDLTKATCTLEAEGVGNEELALVGGRLAQVVKIIGREVTLQVFGGTEGLFTNTETVFLGHAPTLKVGDDLIGRFLNVYGAPIDNGPRIAGHRNRNRRANRKPRPPSASPSSSLPRELRGST